MAQALAIGGSLVSAGGTILGARSEAKALRKEAAQLEANAGTERAMSQRSAMEERRQARIIASRGVAVAAASGGGVDDPTVLNILANIEGEGEYRALTQLYNGEEEARGLEGQAKARRKEAKNVKTASYFKAMSTILSSGSGMADRLGGKRPVAASPALPTIASNPAYTAFNKAVADSARLREEVAFRNRTGSKIRPEWWRQ